jgi:hypothetical protein
MAADLLQCRKSYPKSLIQLVSLNVSSYFLKLHYRKCRRVNQAIEFQNSYQRLISTVLIYRVGKTLLAESENGLGLYRAQPATGMSQQQCVQ